MFGLSCNFVSFKVEKDHTFKALRHFPELRHSLADITNCQNTQGRDFTAKFGTKKEIPREVKLKSTHKLGTLAQSSLGEITALTSFRRVLAAERSRQRDEISQTFTQPKTLSPLASANERLTKASLSFDSRCMINVLDGFQGCSELTKKEFEVQLRRCLNILLSPAEFDALFISMDVNNSNTIDAVEFTRYFFKLGNDARDVIRQKVRKMKENEKKIKKREQLEGLERCAYATLALPIHVSVFLIIWRIVMFTYIWICVLCCCLLVSLLCTGTNLKQSAK